LNLVIAVRKLATDKALRDHNMNQVENLQDKTIA
jgi:hypothetical protein